MYLLTTISIQLLPGQSAIVPHRVESSELQVSAVLHWRTTRKCMHASAELMLFCKRQKMERHNSLSQTPLVLPRLWRRMLYLEKLLK